MMRTISILVNLMLAADACGQYDHDRLTHGR